MTGTGAGTVPGDEAVCENQFEIGCGNETTAHRDKLTQMMRAKNSKRIYSVITVACRIACRIADRIPRSQSTIGPSVTLSKSR